MLLATLQAEHCISNYIASTNIYAIQGLRIQVLQRKWSVFNREPKYFEAEIPNKSLPYNKYVDFHFLSRAELDESSDITTTRPGATAINR